MIEILFSCAASDVATSGTSSFYFELANFRFTIPCGALPPHPALPAAVPRCRLYRHQHAIPLAISHAIPFTSTVNGTTRHLNGTASITTPFAFPPWPTRPLPPPHHNAKLQTNHYSHHWRPHKRTRQHYQMLTSGNFIPSTLHFNNFPGFFAQGFKKTHTYPYDYSETARILNRTWTLDKNRAAGVVRFLAWGAGQK